MQLGDLIYDSHFSQFGIVVETEKMFNECGDWCVIIYDDGSKVKNIRSWEETIEVINASR